jgi:hydroxymethylglutaryl-CoA lyase
MSLEEKLDVASMENMAGIAHLLGENKNLLPKKVDMLELLLRDGLQHAPKYIPVYTKLWFADQIAKAGYKMMEVTNFGHPTILPQTVDAEEILELTYKLPSVRENNVHLKCYAMTIPAFERIAKCCQKGCKPDMVAFTISTEDLHGRRNSGRCRAEYWKEIPELVRIAKENGFEVDMAIACVYGSPCCGPVPIQNTFDLIDRGLDLGIRYFTPCDTTGESNPLRSYLHMAALVDRYGKYDDEMKYRIAHFHESRGMSIANYVAAILGGARIIEGSLGLGGGQPGYVVDGSPGHGSGPLYTNSWEVGNGSSEDLLVCIDEMGIETGIDVDRVLQLGRVFEWVMDRTLPVWTTKSGRPIKQPVEWAIAPQDLGYIPPFGKPEVYWADPSRYKPATMEFIQKQFEGRPLAMDPWEDKVKNVAEQEVGKTAIYSHGGPKFGGEDYKYSRASDEAPKRWFLLPPSRDK